jgi:DNA-binding NarL/FixJ family response regulator
MPAVLLIDGHGVFRSGIRNLIEAGVEHCRVVESPQFERSDLGDPFDLLLIDSECLNQHSRDLLDEARDRSPRTRLALMSTSNARSDVLSCLSAGFHGFVHKLQSDDELLTAIADLLTGRIYVPRWLADSQDNRSAQSATPQTTSFEREGLRLTRRQNEILPLLAQGMSNKEISRELNIAEGTSKIHTAALLRALGARNRTEAAFMAAKLVIARRPSNNPFSRRFKIGTDAKLS